MKTTNKLIFKNLIDHEDVLTKFKSLNVDKIEEICKILSEKINSDSIIFWCGNGGSAADSQHLAAELVGKYEKERSALKSIALTTDSSVITCVANDFGYSEIFSRQIEALGSEKDVLIAISTSGKSENIILALKKAKEIGLTTILMTGNDISDAHKFSDYVIDVPSNKTARIQEIHILTGHIMCEYIEKELLN